MKGGLTKRIENTLTALDRRQLKKALYLTETKGLERHHGWVVEAAQTCLANKKDKEVCGTAMKEAREKMQGTITVPMDDEGLEGVEELIEPVEPASGTAEQVAEAREIPTPKTDEELFEECTECHVAVAATKFAEVCRDFPEQLGDACRVVAENLEDQNTSPAEWLKTMIETAEKTDGDAKQVMTNALAELTEYLERRNSPLLQELDKQ